MSRISVRVSLCDVASRGDRGKHRPATFAETYAGASVALAEPSHDDLIAILEEATLLAGRQGDRFRPAPCQLLHTATRILRRTGHRPAREQIAGIEVAAVAGVVRDELRECPVHLREPH